MTKTIKLDHLTKIEGHASLTVKIRNGKVERCDLGSTEGSRYFEGIVRGRQFHEAPELTSRICGICSCAHTLASAFAMENALHVQVSEQTMTLRKLLNWGERIRSHATHLYFLSLPDFLGYESALAMLPKYKKEITTALQIMKIGNQLVSVVGGRDLHPVSAQIGGFLTLPKQEQLDDLTAQLKACRPLAQKTVSLFASLRYPRFERELANFSVYHEKEYAMLTGVIRTGKKDYPIRKYHDYLKEYHERDSTANFVVKAGKEYRVGALARVNTSKDLLAPAAKRAAATWFPSQNPFHTNYAQAVELLHAIETCISILETLELKPEPPRRADLKSGHGIAAIEAPRGTLWHEYLVKDRKIVYCNIITPTAQNLRSMQEDIRAFLPRILTQSQQEIIDSIEKLIRAYDPCFSCSSHFLDVTWV
ncbi:MAG: Ni/Fe hydrogenase subunit alpha [Nanoarchaeota archaeon]|nr:Ni/Fe hydrogenase subunit alpha [Nanoarchaeota archaeon]